MLCLCQSRVEKRAGRVRAVNERWGRETFATTRTSRSSGSPCLRRSNKPSPQPHRHRVPPRNPTQRTPHRPTFFSFFFGLFLLQRHVVVEHPNSIFLLKFSSSTTPLVELLLSASPSGVRAHAHASPSYATSSTNCAARLVVDLSPQGLRVSDVG